MITPVQMQFRAAALGFWPGANGPGQDDPAEVFDGKLGPNSTRAISDATAAQGARGRPFIGPSGLTRIHWHWTVGHHKAGPADLVHYHRVFEGDGNERQPFPDIKPLSHTLECNGGAIGLSLCGMVGAQERPFRPGPEPITLAAIAAMIGRTAHLCAEYDIPVSRYATLSHAEVQPTLGVHQKGKWDIAWLPGMNSPSLPIAVGDLLRVRVIQAIRALGLHIPLGSIA